MQANTILVCFFVALIAHQHSAYPLGMESPDVDVDPTKDVSLDSVDSIMDDSEDSSDESSSESPQFAIESPESPEVNNGLNEADVFMDVPAVETGNDDSESQEEDTNGDESEDDSTESDEQASGIDLPLAIESPEVNDGINGTDDVMDALGDHIDSDVSTVDSVMDDSESQEQD